MKITIEVETEVDSEYYTYDVTGKDTPQSIFKRWQEDRSYRKELKNVKKS